MFKAPEQYRVTTGLMASDKSQGSNGFFIIPHPFMKGYEVRIQMSDGGVTPESPKWEHASVSMALTGEPAVRCPLWEEMCWVKDLLWDEDDCVVQYHPPKSKYVNMHHFVLHLWRPVDEMLPEPDSIMVGLNRM